MATKKDVNQIKDSISELTKVVHDIRDDLISVKDKIILALRAENERLTARIKSLEISHLQSAQSTVESMLYLTEISGADKRFSWRSGAHAPFSDALAHNKILPKNTSSAGMNKTLSRRTSLYWRKPSREKVLHPLSNTRKYLQILTQ